MKKAIGIILGILLIAGLSACGKEAATSKTDVSKETLEAQTDFNAENDVADGELYPVNEKETDTETMAREDGVDVDLTELSSTMVYSEVYNMMAVSEDYMGKIIKMKGVVTVYNDEITKEDYYACVIRDATACCAQGIEFELEDGLEYPEEGSEVTVVGRFDTYKIENYEYCTLRNATLVE